MVRSQNKVVATFDLVQSHRGRIRENSDLLQGSEVSRRRLRIVATPKLRMDEALAVFLGQLFQVRWPGKRRQLLRIIAP